jgi:predicted O-linked N-acetylglucosamine transferase (SPINDLY family)
MPELITHDSQSYENLAIELGCDVERMRGLKRRLEDCSLRSPLFDTARLAAHLEDCYEEMQGRWIRGERATSLRCAARPRHA